ncbi:Rrf2 family nitric oxide-sensitive transcriptional repressor [Sulfitobacter undariae]|uniref:Rrf2 family nitric oxide-sensitive transcriptional repressor n=1 Tax=Sulfitobacter undariae TaxID=1563671 RepID=A0A7W6E3Q2_9RHOB|nr:Rrf2 family transcriptional regulator [Sulfitobacter undariae]MBB3993714.1 Rrf2 family nitric oxide-sensitive transcriptional repressor [Sulfitobacter undariae]
MSDTPYSAFKIRIIYTFYVRITNAIYTGMQLDKFTDYALRVLITLAVKSPERVPTSHIASLFNLSENHLSKVATQLAREGFVLSERGRHGGLTLARPADQINIGAVVRAMKRGDPVVECFGTNQSCLILPVCGLRGPLAQAQEAFFATLDAHTLADVTSPRESYASFLAT